VEPVIQRRKMIVLVPHPSWYQYYCN